ncbi:DUF2510 domain-containing protein [Kribbella sp. VKM Ac-2568]|uniref:DUF2510 domain-containing protein n=1 Tax=Kribbella sp. VKM Ac-2568 TaxID=2512219 RepID=UPI0010F41FD3|nr:DUF2510 domain-containing protein [Kribbella sp. VKM Ac-2568]TCM44307.1 uncharacterized protein DUF2510 [Kribbella sp. VKM Ac-2568]
MSNPPVGWYPDPTGQPNTLRWWNGTQWTNKTEKEDVTPDAAEAETEAAAISAAEKAKSTWMEPATIPSAANHWTQQPAPDEPDTAPEPVIEPVTEPVQTGWTLKLADAGAAGSDAGAQGKDGQENSWTEPISAAQQAEGWGPTSWTQQPSQPVSQEPTQATNSQTPANTWGLPDEQQTTAATTWGIPDEQQTAAANTWGLPDEQANAANTQAVPDEEQTAVNTWGLPDEQAVPDHGDLQTPPPPWRPTPNQWEVSGDQQTAPNQWEVSADQQQTAGNQWQASGEQAAPNQWEASAGQQTAPTQWEAAVAQQQHGGNQWQGSGDGQAAADPWQVNQAGAGPWQAGGGGQTATEPWQGGQQGGGQQQGVGQEQGAGQWQSGGAGQWPVEQGGGPGRIKPDNGGKEGKGGGSKLPLIVAAVVAFVLIVAAGVFFLSQRDDKTAGPDPTPPPTSAPPSPTNAPTTPGNQTTGAPGQSKNPKLHEAPRVASEAISFPRQGQPWSERKRLIAQLINSSGQYVRLQENFDGENDWYADMFVGALGTGTPFNGNPQATASDLMLQARSSMYGDIPVTFKPRANGPVKRSGKAGWFYQQTVTVNSTKVTSRVLTLTVAVFDLGDGIAVAYISDIPVNRPDLRTAEAQVYKGINVG